MTTPSRDLLDPNRVSPEAMREISAFHTEIVEGVKRALSASPVVVVGMAQNVHVKRVRKALKKAGIAFEYIEHGSYFSKWQERLAIKLWSGWPTFPQVFVRGKLIGGEDLTVAALKDGSLQRMLAEPTVP
jgi:monothiol glutaredoxin